jgi:hypothetical protein
MWRLNLGTCHCEPLCCFAASVGQRHVPIFRRRISVFPASGPRPASFVIPSGAQRSRGIWPAIVRAFPFETGFLHYVTLRITSVGMTECSLSLFIQKSMRFLGGHQ